MSRNDAGAGPAPVGDVLRGFLQRTGLAERLARTEALGRWDECVGERIAGVTRPLRVSGTTLIVGVRSSAWLAELNLLRSKILARLNAGRRRGRIEKLVFVLETDGDGPGGGEGGGVTNRGA